MRRVESISKELRTQLKARIDAIGRQEIADLTGYRYGTLSDKLSGRLPITEKEYHELSSECDKLVSCSK